MKSADKAWLSLWASIVAAYFVIFSFFGCSMAGGQTPTTRPAPFGLSADQQAAYYRGYLDGAAPTPLPSIIVPPLPVPDRAYGVSVYGDDKTGDGSEAAPFASIGRAITQAQRDGAKKPQIVLTDTGNYSGINLPRGGFTQLVILGARGPGVNRPTIKGSIAALSSADYQLRGLAFVDPSPGPATRPTQCAIATNGCDRLVVDNCLIDGFSDGIDCLGGDSPSFTRCGFFNQANSLNQKSQGLYIQGPTGTPRIDGCTFVHCGWREPYQSAQDGTIQQSHAVYVNLTGGSAPVTFTNSIAIDCASTGPQMRSGGSCTWSIFRLNGHAADVVLKGAAGGIEHCFFLGPAAAYDAPPNWGGGILIQSLAGSVNDCGFFCSANTPLDACVTIGWDAADGPLPIGTTASVNNLWGAWRRPTIATQANRIVTVHGAAVRPAAAQERGPGLADYYGCSESQVYTVLRQRVGMGDAPAMFDWFARSK